MEILTCSKSAREQAFICLPRFFDSILRLQFFSEFSALRPPALIIRLRADLWFHSQVKLPRLLPLEVCTPWWGRYGGVNDRFAVMGALAQRPQRDVVGDVRIADVAVVDDVDLDARVVVKLLQGAKAVQRR